MRVSSGLPPDPSSLLRLRVQDVARIVYVIFGMGQIFAPGGVPVSRGWGVGE
mgnify:CR=1 FL=1